MEVGGSMHGNTWEFPLSVEVKYSIAFVNCSFHEYIPWKLHELPSTPKYFNLFPRVSHTSSCFYKTAVRVHRPPFDLRPWNFPPTSMGTSMEANLLPCKQTYFHRNYHGRRWK